MQNTKEDKNKGKRVPPCKANNHLSGDEIKMNKNENLTAFSDNNYEVKLEAITFWQLLHSCNCSEETTKI